MSAARLAPVYDADFDEIGEQRLTDRRANDRRALRLKLDPLFAATLVNQIAPAQRTFTSGYAGVTKVRCGAVLNLRV